MGLYAWEQGASVADTIPRRDLEVPELVPDADGVGPNMKEARWYHYQCGQRRWRWEE